MYPEENDKESQHRFSEKPHIINVDLLQLLCYHLGKDSLCTAEADKSAMFRIDRTLLNGRRLKKHISIGPFRSITSLNNDKEKKHYG